MCEGLDLYVYLCDHARPPRPPRHRQSSAPGDIHVSASNRWPQTARMGQKALGPGGKHDCGMYEIKPAICLYAI